MAVAQTITLSGDVTGTGTSAITTTIGADKVLDTMLRNSAGFSVIGKTATGTGDPADIVAADETVLGRTAAGNLVFAQVATGQIATAAVTLAKQANLAANSIQGNNTGGAAVPLALTAAQVKTLLAIAQADVASLVSDLALKAAIASQAFTGTPSLPTGTTATTQAAGTNNTSLATTAFVTAINNNAAYSTLMNVSASHTAGKVAGTYALSGGDLSAVGGTGTAYPLGVIQIVGADLPTINGITTKLRIRAQLYTNDTAPTGNFTFGLYPITRPATSGGAGVCIFTIGTVVSGSNGATFTGPAVDLLGSAVGADFVIPADGPYVIAVVTTGTVAVSAHVLLHAQLQTRNA